MDNTSQSEIQQLFKTVVQGGYCIGCGACSSVQDSPIKMKLDQFSKYQAFVSEEDLNNPTPVLSICPFSNKSQNEDQIGEALYNNVGSKDNKLGYIISTYAGHVAEKPFRDEGSSGGMGSWILTELLKQKLVDKVIHVKAREKTNDNEALFEYSISSSQNEIISGAKSRYYPIEVSNVIALVRAEQVRFAIVGLPCFIKSIRLLALEDSVLNDRIKFCVGLICGHLKSASFSKMWGWQVGIRPSDIEAINFRTKLDNYGANNYGVTVKGKVLDVSTTIISPPLKQLFGGDWGWGLFKYQACDFCDDVVAETADITIGDAWLPQYLDDSLGTNVIIIRNKVIEDLINQAKSEGRLVLDNLTPKQVVQSQNSGFNHRREGLAYRLSLKDKEAKWRPLKRVLASERSVNDRIKRRQVLRAQIAEQSHIIFNEAIEKDDFGYFTKGMMPIISAYKTTYVYTIWERALNKILKVTGLNKYFSL